MASEQTLEREVPPVRRRPDPGVAAAHAVGAVVAAIVLGGVFGTLAELTHERSVDVRLALVAFGAATALVGFRLTRPGSSRRARLIHAVLAFPMIAALLAPKDALAMTYLVGGVLGLGASSIVHAVRSAAALAPHRVLAVLGGAVVTILCTYPWLAASVVFFNTQLIVAPARLFHRNPTIDRGERRVVIETLDGYRLGATYTPGEPGAGAVVLAHGVSDGRTRLAPWARALRRDLGVHVLRVDLRAHGTSEGAVCTYGQRESEDVIAAVDRIAQLARIDRVVVVGASMGGGAVLAAGPSLADRNVRGLVLIAPASSYPPLVERRTRLLGPLRPIVLAASSRIAHAIGQIPMTQWVPRARMHGVSMPLLVIHGSDDTDIPMRESEALAHETGGALLQVPGVDHVSGPLRCVQSETCWGEVTRFVDAHLSR